MAFVEVGGAKKYKKYSQMQPGEIVTQGYYTQTTQGKFGPQYEIVEDDGTVFSLNKSGQVTHKFGMVEPGDYVLVKYLGTQTLTKGTFAGKEANNVSVSVDPTRFALKLWRQYAHKRPEGKPIPVMIQDLLAAEKMGLIKEASIASVTPETKAVVEDDDGFTL